MLFGLLATSLWLALHSRDLSAAAASSIWILIVLLVLLILWVMPKVLCRAIAHPAHLRECSDAAQWCERAGSEFGGDPSRVVLVGESAGGQLALLLAVAAAPGRRLRLSSIVVLSAPVDYRQEALLRLSWPARVLVRRTLLRTPFGLNPVDWEAASPMAHLEGGGLGHLRLLLVAPKCEFFGIPWLERQFDVVFRRRALAATARAGGADVRELELNAWCHFTAVGSLAVHLGPQFVFLVDKRQVESQGG